MYALLTMDNVECIVVWCVFNSACWFCRTLICVHYGLIKFSFLHLLFQALNLDHSAILCLSFFSICWYLLVNAIWHFCDGNEVDDQSVSHSATMPALVWMKKSIYSAKFMSYLNPQIFVNNGILHFENMSIELVYNRILEVALRR